MGDDEWSFLPEREPAYKRDLNQVHIERVGFKPTPGVDQVDRPPPKEPALLIEQASNRLTIFLQSMSQHEQVVGSLARSGL
jgi:hypothetical protein